MSGETRSFFIKNCWIRLLHKLLIRECCKKYNLCIRDVEDIKSPFSLRLYFRDKQLQKLHAQLYAKRM